MALTKTQSEFVLKRLGVAPKGRVNNPLSKDSALRRKLEDYLRREEKVVEAVNALRAIDVAEPVADELERQVNAIQKSVTDAEREGGGKALEEAFKSLEAIKTKARDELLPAYQQYVQQRTLARAAVHQLTQPVLGDDVKALRKSRLTGAEELAREGKTADATNLLLQVDGECNRLRGLSSAYDTALADAKKALQDARAKMLKVDIDFVQLTLLDAAVAEAAKGKRQAALDLLAKVAPHCTQADSANLKGYDGWMTPLDDLKKHAQAKHFTAEIAGLDKRVTVANKNAAAGLSTKTDDGSGNNSSPVSKELALIHWEAKKHLAFANQHAAHAAELTRVQALVKTLRDAAPPASNAAIDNDLKAIDKLIEKADRQAARRLYENADASLKEAEKATGAATLLKQAHADYTTRVGVLEPRITGLKPAPGSQSEAAEKQDLQNRLTAAKALADPGGKFAEARDALVALATLVDAAVQLADAGKQAVDKGQAALKNVGSDLPGSLAEVRKLLAALKTRAGHEGIASQLQAIEKTLGDAAKALA
jgi:hypothetical protein